MFHADMEQLLWCEPDLKMADFWPSHIFERETVNISETLTLANITTIDTDFPDPQRNELEGWQSTVLIKVTDANDSDVQHHFLVRFTKINDNWVTTTLETNADGTYIGVPLTCYVGVKDPESAYRDILNILNGVTPDSLTGFATTIVDPTQPALGLLATHDNTDVPPTDVPPVDEQPAETTTDPLTDPIIEGADQAAEDVNTILSKMGPTPVLEPEAGEVEQDEMGPQ